MFITRKNKFTALWVIKHFPLVLVRVRWRQCIMFGTEGSKVRGIGLVLYAAERRIRTVKFWGFWDMLRVDWYKITEFSEEPAASFVGVQKVREEDRELVRKEILRHVVTTHGSTQRHIVESFILNQRHCENPKYLSLCKYGNALIIGNVQSVSLCSTLHCISSVLCLKFTVYVKVNTLHFHCKQQFWRISLMH